MTTMKPTYYYSESCVHISVNNSEELLFVIVGSSSFLSTEHGTTLMLKINKSEITFFVLVSLAEFCYLVTVGL